MKLIIYRQQMVRSKQTKHNMDIRTKSYSDRKKRIQWTPEAVKFLLHLWQEFLPRMRNTKRNGHIYIEMSLQMIKNGYNFNAREVNVKLHNLTNKYKDERKKIKRGLAFESDWCFYNQVDYLLGNRISYESFIAKCTDPLNEFSEEFQVSDENTPKEDVSLKAEEENSLQPEANAWEAADIDQPSDCSSSEVYAYESDQSMSEAILLSEASAAKEKYSETNPKSNDNSSFRIIADRSLPRRNRDTSNKDTSARNGIRPSFVPKKLSTPNRSENPNVQSLNLAKWELVQLQISKIKQEMEYQKQEFEQKRQEHKLRLRHLEEEHGLRMWSLRNDLKTNSKGSITKI